MFSTVCHEAAHAWASNQLGDDTAFRGGQVTLDPTPHIRRAPVGMVVVPLLSYFLGGWMIGWASAPYSVEWALRFPRRCALMALAGPLANGALVVAATVLMRIGVEWGTFQAPAYPGFLSVVAAFHPDGLAAFFAKMLSLTFALNLLLGIFNLLPIPPLDGCNFPLLFLRGQAAINFWSILRKPWVSQIGMLMAWKVFGFGFPELFQWATSLVDRHILA